MVAVYTNLLYAFGKKKAKLNTSQILLEYSRQVTQGFFKIEVTKAKAKHRHDEVAWLFQNSPGTK